MTMKLRAVVRTCADNCIPIFKERLTLDIVSQTFNEDNCIPDFQGAAHTVSEASPLRLERRLCFFAVFYYKSAVEGFWCEGIFEKF